MRERDSRESVSREREREREKRERERERELQGGSWFKKTYFKKTWPKIWESLQNGQGGRGARGAEGRESP